MYRYLVIYCGKYGTLVGNPNIYGDVWQGPGHVGSGPFEWHLEEPSGNVFCEVVQGDWTCGKVLQASLCRWLSVEPERLEVMKGEESERAMTTESTQGSGKLLENFLQTKQTKPKPTKQKSNNKTKQTCTFF